MRPNNHSIGLKQTIRLEWMDKTAQMVLAGMAPETIRAELHEYLSDRKSDGTRGERSEGTSAFVVGNLMRVWVLPTKELSDFREKALSLYRGADETKLAVSWAMLSVTYPFWWVIGLQVGRLLRLQEQITHRQLISRLKELYGDRTTVGREGQRVIRSFVAWGVLRDTNRAGTYEKAKAMQLNEEALCAFMIEAAIRADARGRLSFSEVIRTPALFPFGIKTLATERLSAINTDLEVTMVGRNDCFLSLKTSNKKSNEEV